MSGSKSTLAPSVIAKIFSIIESSKVTGVVKVGFAGAVCVLIQMSPSLPPEGAELDVVIFLTPFALEAA